MNFENLKPRPKNENDALAAIELARQQAWSMGRNDCETDVLNGIRELLIRREITPEEAIQKANEIVDAKNPT